MGATDRGPYDLFQQGNLETGWRDGLVPSLLIPPFLLPVILPHPHPALFWFDSLQKLDLTENLHLKIIVNYTNFV
jgi:hypothetical protein